MRTYSRNAGKSAYQLKDPLSASEDTLTAAKEEGKNKYSCTDQKC